MPGETLVVVWLPSRARVLLENGVPGVKPIVSMRSFVPRKTTALPSTWNGKAMLVTLADWTVTFAAPTGIVAGSVTASRVPPALGVRLLNVVVPTFTWELLAKPVPTSVIDVPGRPSAGTSRVSRGATLIGTVASAHPVAWARNVAFPAAVACRSKRVGALAAAGIVTVAGTLAVVPVPLNWTVSALMGGGTALTPIAAEAPCATGIAAAVSCSAACCTAMSTAAVGHPDVAMGIVGAGPL